MIRVCKWQPAGLPVFVLALLATTQVVWASDTQEADYSALSTTLLQRAQNEVNRIEILVREGTLPKSRLEEAQIQLADAEDEAILAHTLYGELRIGDMSSEDAQSMIDAAQRRVDRQSNFVETRRTLLEAGVLAKSEFAAFEEDLNSRKRALVLAQNRSKLLDDLRQMADQEQRFERAARYQGRALKDVLVRYDGNGQFDLGDLTIISSEFQKRFGQSLPISALGQTLVHQSMGLDHRNRVDVALNPDLSEGLWLRGFLERLHIPYLAFRSAIPRAATAPHIHIGSGSTRLRFAER